jgi:hypothetical protein
MNDQLTFIQLPKLMAENFTHKETQDGSIRKRLEDDPEAILRLIDLIFGPRFTEESFPS